MAQMHLDTIPVWDAYKQDTECPLCLMERTCEKQFLDVTLGGAMMEPDTRIATNGKGFCSAHFEKLFDAQNRLSLALMVHTHLKDLWKNEQKQAELLKKQIETEKKKNPLANAAGDLTKSTPLCKQIESMAAYLDGRARTCFICARIENTMERYIETIFHLYKKDEDFKATFLQSKGVCMHHYPQILRGSTKHLSGGARRAFLEDFLALMQRSLAGTEADLEWFTLKFDYRNQDKPWNNSRDAVERSMNKLRGRVIETTDDN